MSLDQKIKTVPKLVVLREGVLQPAELVSPNEFFYCGLDLSYYLEKTTDIPIAPASIALVIPVYMGDRTVFVNMNPYKVGKKLDFSSKVRNRQDDEYLNKTILEGNTEDLLQSLCNSSNTAESASKRINSCGERRSAEQGVQESLYENLFWNKNPVHEFFSALIQEASVIAAKRGVPYFGLEVVARDAEQARMPVNIDLRKQTILGKYSKDKKKTLSEYSLGKDEDYFNSTENIVPVRASFAFVLHPTLALYVLKK